MIYQKDPQGKRFASAQDQTHTDGIKRSCKRQQRSHGNRHLVVGIRAVAWRTPEHGFGHIGWLSRPPGAGLTLRLAVDLCLDPVQLYTLMHPEESYDLKHGPLTKMLCCMALKDWLPLP